MSKRKRRSPNALNPLEQGENSQNTWFSFYYNYLVELALSVFEWKNLPDSIDQRYLELSLLQFGNVLFFNDKYTGLGFMVSQTTLGGRINHYLNPTEFYTCAPMYSGYKYNLDNSVPIFNNYLRTPTFPALELYAHDLANITEIININQNAQKTPFALMSDDYNKLTVKNAFKNIDGNSPALIMNKDFDMSALQVLNFNAPYVVDKLQYQKNMKWNEIMTFLGINNANMDKKERVQGAEVESNNAQVNMARFNMQKAREQACEQINNMFDLEVEVVPRESNDLGLGSMAGMPGMPIDYQQGGGLIG